MSADQPQSLLIVANWKMNGLLRESMLRVKALRESLIENKTSHEVVVCPPFTLLRDMAEKVPGSSIKIGGQNCSHEHKGSYTGEISAEMLKDMTCEYVILGHSERRQHYNEQSDLVRQKASAAHHFELTPIICVGETLYEREHNLYKDIIEQQLLHSIPESASKQETVIAYEPVWAIGTDKIPTTKEIAEVHHYISDMLTKKFPSQSFKVIYGGSANGDNAKEILAIDGVDGLLVGRASLEPNDFLKIIRSA